MDHEDHEADPAAFDARARESIAELERQISAQPGVEQVAFADRLPVMDQSTYRSKLDRMTGAPATGIRTSTLVHVSRGFFAAFGTSVVAGRLFAGDKHRVFGGGGEGRNIGTRQRHSNVTPALEMMFVNDDLMKTPKVIGRY